MSELVAQCAECFKGQRGECDGTQEEKDAGYQCQEICETVTVRRDRLEEYVSKYSPNDDDCPVHIISMLQGKDTE